MPGLGVWVLALSAACAAGQTPGASAGAPARPAGADASITDAELAALRPVALADLKQRMAQFDNEQPADSEVEQEFQKCTFTPLNLGKLGRAIVVESDIGAGAQNGGWLGIYVPEHSRWRKIDESAGFRPRTVPRANGIPDLVFVWAAGVCHATYSLVRWQGSQFQAVACDQEVEGKTDSADCEITACEGPKKLPTFPNPWPAGS